MEAQLTSFVDSVIFYQGCSLRIRRYRIVVASLPACLTHLY
jgi:hypothetical protein